MYTNKLEKWSVGAGWAAGIITGITLLLYSNFVQFKYPSLETTFFKFSTPLSFLYVGLIGLVVNLVVVLVGSAIAGSMKNPKQVAATGNSGGK